MCAVGTGAPTHLDVAAPMALQGTALGGATRSYGTILGGDSPKGLQQGWQRQPIDAGKTTVFTDTPTGPTSKLFGPKNAAANGGGLGALMAPNNQYYGTTATKYI